MTKQGDRLILSVSLSNMIASMSVFILHVLNSINILFHIKACAYIYIYTYTQTLVHTYTSWAFLRVSPFVRGTSFPVCVSFHDREVGEKQIECSVRFKYNIFLKVMCKHSFYKSHHIFN